VSIPESMPKTNPAPRQRWVMAQQHPTEAEELARNARIPLVVAELLLARGINTAAEAFEFLNPEYNNLHDPLRMLGVSSAV